MKTHKIQYFLWKRMDSDDIIMYAPLNATSESMPYYAKNSDSSSFGKFTWKSLTDLESSLKRSSYRFICSILIPSDHTTKDISKYYTAMKKKLSL